MSPSFHMLRAHSKTCFTASPLRGSSAALVGSTVPPEALGAYVITMAGQPSDVLAVELSSYQLHWAPSLRAHSAAVLNLRRGTFGFIDTQGGKLVGDQKLECELTVRGGQVVWDLNGISRPMWTEVAKGKS